MKKTTMPGMPEVEVVEIKTSAPVNVLADPAPAKKPALTRPAVLIRTCGKASGHINAVLYTLLFLPPVGPYNRIRYGRYLQSPTAPALARDGRSIIQLQNIRKVG